jgi:hypothetical protein
MEPATVAVTAADGDDGGADSSMPYRAKSDTVRSLASPSNRVTSGEIPHEAA